METLNLLITVAGLVIGLGAVTVIDLHGFLGRTSPYWTEATIRTHKVTKPLIWIGTLLVLLGTVLALQYDFIAPAQFLLRLAIILVLVVNGCFLSFVVSPALIRREREGRATELLSKNLQKKIFVSFVVSFIGWWLLVCIIVSHIVYV